MKWVKSCLRGPTENEVFLFALKAPGMDTRKRQSEKNNVEATLHATQGV